MRTTACLAQAIRSGRTPLLLLGVVLLALAACNDSEDARLDDLVRAGIINESDRAVLGEDLRAGGTRAAGARHDIEIFARSRDALKGAGFVDLDAALRKLEALRMSRAVGAAEADRLESGVAAVWDAPSVSAASRRIAWLDSRREVLHGEPAAAPGKDEAEPPRAALPAPDASKPGAGDTIALRRIDDDIAAAVARGLISPALGHAMRGRALAGPEARAAVETRLDAVLAAHPSVPDAPASTPPSADPPAPFAPSSPTSPPPVDGDSATRGDNR